MSWGFFISGLSSKCHSPILSGPGSGRHCACGGSVGSGGSAKLHLLAILRPTTAAAAGPSPGREAILSLSSSQKNPPCGLHRRGDSNLSKNLYSNIKRSAKVPMEVSATST